MIRTKKRMRLCCTLLVCNLVFIWGNSLLPGEVSQSISDCVKDLLSTLFPGPDGALVNGSGLLRKLAHFAEFACLGMLLYWLFLMLAKPGIYALYCGVAAAFIDEAIQIFAIDRGPGLRDVAIDGSGVLSGMFLLYIGHTYYTKHLSKPLEDTQ